MHFIGADCGCDRCAVIHDQGNTSGAGNGQNLGRSGLELSIAHSLVAKLERCGATTYGSLCNRQMIPS